MSTLVNFGWFVAGAVTAVVGMVAVLFMLEAIARDDPDDMADKRHEADIERQRTLSRSKGSCG